MNWKVFAGICAVIAGGALTGCERSKPYTTAHGIRIALPIASYRVEYVTEGPFNLVMAVDRLKELVSQLPAETQLAHFVVADTKGRAQIVEPSEIWSQEPADGENGRLVRRFAEGEVDWDNSSLQIADVLVVGENATLRVRTGSRLQEVQLRGSRPASDFGMPGARLVDFRVSETAYPPGPSVPKNDPNRYDFRFHVQTDWGFDVQRAVAISKLLRERFGRTAEVFMRQDGYFVGESGPMVDFFHFVDGEAQRIHTKHDQGIRCVLYRGLDCFTLE